MILRNCDWVNEADETPPKAPKKRRVTTAMIAANRANATKSTGPTAESLKKTRFNGVKHGMASFEILFLDGENQQDFWDEVDRRCQEQGVKTEDERTCVANAVYGIWVKGRAINAQVETINDTINNIKNHFFDQKEAEVRELFEDLKAKPEVVVKALMNSSFGCAFLRDQFTSLSDRLKTHYSFEISQRELALRIGGHRPKELFTDKVVAEFNRSYFGSLRGPGGYTAAQMANGLMHDRPEDVSAGEFERRLERLILDLPTIEEGHIELQRYVNLWIDQLTERHELMTYREENQKKAAIGKAKVDVSASGQVLARYITQGGRTYNASMCMMLALKADRRKYADEYQDQEEPATADAAAVAADRSQEENRAPEVASEPVEIEPEPVVVSAVEAPIPTEAVPTQVVLPVVGNNAASAAPAVLLPTPEPIHDDPLEALIEKHRKEFDDLRQYDHLM